MYNQQITLNNYHEKCLNLKIYYMTKCWRRYNAEHGLLSSACNFKIKLNT